MRILQSDTVLLAALALAGAPACTGSEGPAPEVRSSQTQALTSASLSISDSGVRVPTVGSGLGGPVVAKAVLPDISTVPSTAQLALGDATEAATLRSIALQAASTAGVPSPGPISAVAASDHQSAEFILSGAIISDHLPVYVIKVAGGPFTALSAHPGQPHPQGQFLTITVDATTHGITDVGFVSVEPDLRKIGSFVVDL
jgi:hypothetical protein